ncbi:collagen-binding domain-containing protein [Pseudothauera lacus]|uniref:PEP-CTERM sorting domain-containing protein n=1 Tax=Pseudothauera lacus TaxID=2136175 RepID=A0A2T4IIQ1_9RHOO|nr:collagen-binding domain-containing protein [Pseudothauera lacus]PTD97644.1 PEP-CTERM sorting domain-containing protein [Pseudothauera lacus]
MYITPNALRRLTGALACMACVVNAHAAPLSASEILQQFNLVAFGNVVSTSDVDGRAYIGGNVSGGDYAQHPHRLLDSDYAGLVVGGNATRVNVNGGGVSIGGNLANANINQGSAHVAGNASNVNFNGGPAYVGGAAGASNFNGGRTTTATAQPDTAAFESTLRAFSSQLAGLADSGSSVAISGNRASFTAIPGANGIAVFDLHNLDTLVLAASEFDFNLGGAQIVIINIDDPIINIAANFLGGSALSIATQVIWNFHQATAITLHTQFGGTVLAPNAHLTNYNNIEGSVVVTSLQQHGEIHLQPPTTLPPLDPPTGIPAPGTLALLLGSLTLLGLHTRRRAVV